MKFSTKQIIEGVGLSIVAFSVILTIIVIITIMALTGDKNSTEGWPFTITAFLAWIGGAGIGLGVLLAQLANVD